MKIDRRTFLQRAGGAALALPLLQLPARAQEAGPFPKRLVVFFTPNGTKKELWSPPELSSERDFTLGPLLSPLEALKQHLVVIDGVDMAAATAGPGGPHQRGMASLLTGAVITEGDFVGGDGRRAGWGGGISVDQYVAQKLQASTPLGSIELGVRVLEAVPRGRIIYRGSEQPLPPENDPVSAFHRLFGRQEISPEEARRRLLRRQSVLDSVHGDFAALMTRVTRADKEKLERHASALRDLERRLGTIAERPQGCGPQQPGPMGDVMSEDEFRDVLRAQTDLLVNALACDVTRVGSLQCSTAVNAARFTFLGMNESEGHALSHAGDGHELMQDRWERMLLWYAEQFAYLLERLALVPEGDGTLLDNTLVLWGMEISRGNSHALNDIPFILAGGAGGALETGRYLRYDSEPHNNLLVSVLNAMGIEDVSFGDPRFCTGPLSGLL